MVGNPPKTRFAPSPTGRLHLGNARTALFNALLALCEGGVFLLRIEDTDPERSREEFIAGLVEDLQWLGITWQEGYRSGGEEGPYRQSLRAEVYGGDFERLAEAGQAYPCFCTPRELELSRKAQRAAGRPPRYAGTCARLSQDERDARLARGDAATLRFRVPPGRSVMFDDVVRGPQRFSTDDIGDFIIRRADGSPAFFFSNALDDSRMGVTHVLRGEDHLVNTPRQMLLLEALGQPAPAYGHISLIVGEDGSPLSKRLGSVGVQELREQGYLPAAVVNYLARLGHAFPQNDLLELDALARQFDLARLAGSPARFDPAQLRHWQREAISALPPDALWQQVPEAAKAMLPPDRQALFVETVRENVLFPGEFNHWAERLFADELTLETEAGEIVGAAGRAFFDAALQVLDEAADDFKALANGVKAATGKKGKALFQPLRAALSGRLNGPEMWRIYQLLGQDRVRRRLEAARDASE